MKEKILAITVTIEQDENNIYATTEATIATIDPKYESILSKLRKDLAMTALTAIWSRTSKPEAKETPK